VRSSLFALFLAACGGEEAQLPLDIPFTPSNLTDLRYPQPGNLVVRANATFDASAETPAISGADEAYTLARVIEMPGGRQAVLFVADEITIAPNASLTVVAGELPVIFLATGNVAIDGSLVVAANGALPREGLASGADGPAEEATDGAGDGPGGAADEAAHVGGGGGGHCGAGGAGAEGATNGGAAYGNTELVPLEGGSSGGSGRGGPGGAGGGAVQISAGGWITIGGTGIIHAGGGGGGTGGSGGGAGGSILLEAEVVSVSGTVAANGGGGGANDPGEDRQGRNGSADSTPAPGGRLPADQGGPQNSGGDGAAGAIVDGGAGAYLAAPGAPLMDIGGGGGGGAGRIRVNSASGMTEGNGRLSPSPDSTCATLSQIDSAFFD
jgi:hypothetical protein